MTIMRMRLRLISNNHGKLGIIDELVDQVRTGAVIHFSGTAPFSFHRDSAY